MEEGSALAAGSGSTVLTATGFVYRNSGFRPPWTESTPLNRSPRYL